MIFEYLDCRVGGQSLPRLQRPSLGLEGFGWILRFWSVELRLLGVGVVV